ncbi:MAG TPA: hypothetical protein VG937_09975 [Polyangiaceae bacterium]|nr:hypothetical protein [Polyangiaceae bacterium]
MPPAIPRLESLIAILDRSKKRLALAFGAAVLLHFPLTPALPLLRLAHRLTDNKAETQPPPPQEVEVDLREAVRSEEKRIAQKAEPPPSKAASMQMEPPSPIKFAGGEKPAAEPEKANEKPEEKPKEPPPKEPLQKEKVKSVGLEGLSSKPADRPAMTLGIWFGTLRESPLGKRLIELASCDREWKRFMDQGVDPLKDLDGVLVVGPGLFHSDQLTAAVRHELPAERVRTVMESLVSQSKDRGRWLEPDVASVRLGRSQRVLLSQQSDLFFITPSKGWEALRKVKEPLRVPSAEGRAASLSFVKPNRVLSRVGLKLPKRIDELRLEIFANLDESADIRVELEATSAEAASAEAKQVTEQMHDFFSDVWTTASALRTLTGNGDGNHLETAPRLDLEVDDRVLSGMVHLSPNQTRATLDLLASLSCKKGKPAAPAAAKPAP